MGYFKDLKNAGVLGINSRNANYIMRQNPRHLYPLVDDKIRTKHLALEHGLPVPEMYGIISTQHDAAHLPVFLHDKESFVVKPASGSGGDGIMVINTRRGGRFGAIGGGWYSEAVIDHHISNILTGMYSLGGLPDRAMLEAMVRFDPCFEEVAYQGVPDIRVIVYQGVPVMAMLRLPTQDVAWQGEPAPGRYRCRHRHDQWRYHRWRLGQPHHFRASRHRCRNYWAGGSILGQDDGNIRNGIRNYPPGLSRSGPGSG